LRRHGRAVEALHLGLPDAHIAHGSQAEQLAACRLDAPGIKRSIEEKLATLAKNIQSRA